MDISSLINEHVGYAQSIRAYRAAVRPDSRALSTPMAALFGSRQRRTAPVLSVAVEAVAGKLFLRTLAVDNEGANTLLQGWLTATGFSRLERNLWEAVVRDGRAFVLVTWDSGNNRPVLTLRLAFDGKEGVLLTSDGVPVNVYTISGNRCVDIFYPDRIEKYQYDTEKQKWVIRQDYPGEVWPTDWTNVRGEGLGTALIAFGDGQSAIAAALQPADDLDEALLDLMATSRSQGWPQRYISGDATGVLTNTLGQIITDKVGAPIRREINLEPGSLMRLDKGSAIGQLPPATGDRTVVDVLTEFICLLTSVPQHYFSGNWPSGIALLTAERRLNAKVEDYQGLLASPLESLVSLMFRLAEVFGGLSATTNRVVVAWYPPEIETEEVVRDRESATASLFRDGLLSLEAAVERLHPDWSEDQRALEISRLQRSMPAQ